MLLNKKNNKVLFLVLIIILVFTFIFLQKPIRSFFYSVSQPIQQHFWSEGLRVSGFWSGVFNARELKIENEGLKNKNQFILSRIIELNHLRDENQKLREALDLGLAEDFQLLGVNILSKNIFRDFIIINKGAMDGVEEEMLLINFQKVLIGEVDKVYKNSSRVRLLTSDEMSLSVQIGEDGIRALAEGRGNQRMVLDLIPADYEILPGSLVVTSAPQIGFPSGLLIGKTRAVERTDLSPFQKVEIKIFFDIRAAHLLFLISN